MKIPICPNHKEKMRATQGFLEQSGHQQLPTTKWVCVGPCEYFRWDRPPPGTPTRTDPKWLAALQKGLAEEAAAAAKLAADEAVL